MARVIGKLTALSLTQAKKRYDLPVLSIDGCLDLTVVESVGTAKPETASRLRGRVESVLDWASARGYCTGDNPARWRGHLDNLLPPRSKVKTVEHHPAMP